MFRKLVSETSIALLVPIIEKPQLRARKSSPQFQLSPPQCFQSAAEDDLV